MPSTPGADDSGISDGPGADGSLSRMLASFRALAEAADEGMYMLRLHPQRILEYINPAARRILDLSDGDDGRMDDVLMRRLAADERRALERARQNPDSASWPLQLGWARRDGTIVRLLVRESALRDGTGDVTGVAGLVQDVSTQDRREIRLRDAMLQKQRATEQLQRADQIRQTFLRAVSHELRTPLTAVLGYAETLRYHRERLDGERTDDLISRLTENALRLRSLLDDLLDVDRLSRGTLALEARVTDVSEIVLRAVEQMSAPAGRVRVNARSVRARIDGPKIERLVENLIANALKHGGADVTVWVWVEDAGDDVRITVEDDGRGISEELRERLFEAFEQGDESATAASPGSGIGLSLVRDLARLHDGDVHVTEREGGGARFVVTLPKNLSR